VRCLPPSWITTTLSEVTREITQGEPTHDEEFFYIDIASVNRETKQISSPQKLLGKEAPSRARKKVHAGDVLVSMTRPNLNAVALVPKELDGQIASTGFDVLRAASIDPRWIFYLVRTTAFIDQMSSLVQGALYPAIRAKDVREYQIPLAPLEEQKRIADKLDAVLARVDACLDHLDRIPAILKRFRQSVLSAAVSGQLTEEWRKTHSIPDGEAGLQVERQTHKKTGRLKVRGQPIRMDKDYLYELPPSWSWVLNHQLAVDESNAICAGPFGTIFKAKDFRTSGVPIIFLRHIGEGKYLRHKPGFMDEAVWRELHQPYTVFGGELLVTKLGDPPGAACLYPKKIGAAMVTPDVIKMSVDEQVAIPEYLMHFFNSLPSKKITESICFGVTRLRIDLSLFKTFPIALPPIKEQTEIIRRVESLFAYADRLEARYTTARAQVEKLTPALLAKAFRGELAPQDPNDEPASELLKRLAEGRAPSGDKATRKRRSVSPA
jgi:type I restriction enzyme, S subunit